jgi:hypothetical protein
MKWYEVFLLLFVVVVVVMVVVMVAGGRGVAHTTHARVYWAHINHRVRRLGLVTTTAPVLIGFDGRCGRRRLEGKLGGLISEV